MLMISVGLSPQIVTETLHALHEAGEPLPERLVLLTTARGRAAAQAHLLDPQTGRIAAWGKAWRVPGAARLAAGAEVVVTDGPGGGAETTRSAAQFARVAQRLISEIASDPSTALHVSLAGGRKSAAATLAVLMAIYGRPQDRLTHVVVEPEDAAGSDFFYPVPKATARVFTAGGASLDPSNGRVRLIDLPFVGLGGTGASALTEQLHKAIDTRLGEPRLIIHRETRRITWEGSDHVWPPQPAAFLAMLAEDLCSGGSGLPRSATPRDRFFRHYTPSRRHVGGLADPLDGEWMEEKASRVNRLARECGLVRGTGQLVRRDGRRSSAVYRLALDRSEVALA